MTDHEVLEKIQHSIQDFFEEIPLIEIKGLVGLAHKGRFADKPAVGVHSVLYYYKEDPQAMFEEMASAFRSWADYIDGHLELERKVKRGRIMSDESDCQLIPFHLLADLREEPSYDQINF